MLGKQAEVEFTHDDRYSGLAGSAQVSGKALAFATRLYATGDYVAFPYGRFDRTNKNFVG
jgi:hypothetical protein